MHSLMRILFAATRREWIAYRRTFVAICFMIAALSVLTALLSPSTVARASLFTLLTTSAMTLLVAVTLATEMWRRELAPSSSLARRLPGGLKAMAGTKLLFYAIVQAAGLVWGTMVGVAAEVAVAGPASLAPLAADLPILVLPAMSIATLGPWIGAVTLWGARGVLAIPGVLFLFVVSGVPVFAALGADLPRFVQALQIETGGWAIGLIAFALCGAIIASITLIHGRRFDRNAVTGALTGLAVVALMLMPTYALTFAAVRDWEAATPNHPRFRIREAVLASDGARIWVNTRWDENSPWSCSVIRVDTGEIRRIGGRGEMVRSPSLDDPTATSVYVHHVDRKGNLLEALDSSTGISLPDSLIDELRAKRRFFRLPDGRVATIADGVLRFPRRSGVIEKLPWPSDAVCLNNLGFGRTVFRRGRVRILDLTRGRSYGLPRRFVEHPTHLFELRILSSGWWFVPTASDDGGRILLDPDTGTTREAKGWKPHDRARGIYGKNGVLVVNQRPGKPVGEVVILDPESGKRDPVRLPSSGSMFRFRDPGSFHFGAALGPNLWVLDVGQGFAVLDVTSMSIGAPLLADVLIGRVGNSFFALAGKKTIYRWEPLTGEVRTIFPR